MGYCLQPHDSIRHHRTRFYGALRDGRVVTGKPVGIIFTFSELRVEAVLVDYHSLSAGLRRPQTNWFESSARLGTLD